MPENRPPKIPPDELEVAGFRKLSKAAFSRRSWSFLPSATRASPNEFAPVIAPIADSLKVP